MNHITLPLSFGMATLKVAIESALTRYEILETPPESAFDDLARRAADAFGAQHAGISFFDAYGEATTATDASSTQWREWFKSASGLPAMMLVQGESFFLPFALASSEAVFATDVSTLSRTFVVHDTLAEKTLREHRWVTAAPYVCFYACAIIFSRDRVPVGLLSVFDTAARETRPRELEALVNLAELVSARLEARAEARRERRQRNERADGAASTDTTAQRRASATDPQAEEHINHLTREFVQLEELLEDEIAERQAAELKLRHEKEFSDAAIASLPGAFFMFDKNGYMVRWNKSFQAHTQYSDNEIIVRRAVDFIAPHDRAAIADAIRRVIERGEEISLEADMLAKDGSEAPYSFHGRPLDIGGQRYCLGVGRDITERRRAEREIQDAKERLDLALAGSSLALWDWDLAANEAFFSEGWNETLGVKPTGRSSAMFRSEEVISWCHVEDQPKFEASLLNALKGKSDEFVCDYRVPGKDDDWVWLHSSGKVTERDATGRVRRMTGTTANISARKAAEERVEFLATRDPLTGLPNRALLNDRLETGLKNAARKGTRLAFMFTDLDRFKTINDSLGHDIGDELLKRVAARLSACVRASDTVARLGGDEFAVILENLPQEGQEAQNIAEKMIASLSAPIQAGTHQLTTSGSVGISIFPNDGQDAQTLMKHADVAMYDAKAKGRNNYQFFSQAMNAKAQERLSIETFLRMALRRKELLLYYQPRVGFSTGEVTGVEALLRWKHPRLGLLTPDKFISVAEDSGLIVPIGEWVMEEAFTQVATWQKKSGRSLGVAINLSVGQVTDGKRLMTAIESALKKSQLDAHDVELELTESMLLKNSDDTSNALRRLGDLGIGIAVDNFGTGFSSLSYLKQLPVDSIKVDSSFVRDIGTDANDEAIIRAIIAMTHSLKLNVVAEGVEREEQYRALRDLECDEYQGFYFSKPLPPEEFEAGFL
jgi:diguanylate cyclase (GGDEF)-like protein/PAS domain S-box-containing protein